MYDYEFRKGWPLNPQAKFDIAQQSAHIHPAKMCSRFTSVDLHIHVCVCVCAYACVYTQSHTDNYTHTQTPTNTPTNTHKHTHKHTHASASGKEQRTK